MIDDAEVCSKCGKVVGMYGKKLWMDTSGDRIILKRTRIYGKIDCYDVICHGWYMDLEKNDHAYNAVRFTSLKQMLSLNYKFLGKIERPCEWLCLYAVGVNVNALKYMGKECAGGRMRDFLLRKYFPAEYKAELDADLLNAMLVKFNGGALKYLSDEEKTWVVC